jgi:hypothetical protein
MDFMNRGARPGQTDQVSPEQAPHHTTKQVKSKFWFSTKAGRAGFLSFAVALAILLIAVICFLSIGKNDNLEQKAVDTSKFQAIFLNGGQVYFGKVGELNTKFMQVSNIYYLRVNQQVQPGQTNSSNDVSLVKLGCELHGPQDSMVINREQVIFWENLKSDGQVNKAIDEYVKANPNGQKCDAPAAQNNSSSSSTPASSTPATNNNSSSTPATNNSTNR